MQADPLQQLRGLALPEPPGFWPPAPGWWLLLLLCLALAIWILRAWSDRRRTLAPVRSARTEHRRLRADLAAGAIDAERYLHDGNALLKRVCLHSLDLRSVAAESGDAWLKRLDELSGSQAFSRGAGRALAVSRFAPSVPEVDGALPELIERFFDEASSQLKQRWAQRWLRLDRRPQGQELTP